MNSRVAVVLLSLTGCSSLLYDKGNDFPCDFSGPEGERDKVCAPGEICGVLNHCVEFTYEGPQFEGRPQQPDVTAIRKVHPLTLDGPVTAVTAKSTDLSVIAAVVQSAGQSMSFGIKVAAITSVGPGPVSPVGVRGLGWATDTFGAALLDDGSVHLFDGSPAPNLIYPIKGLRTGNGNAAVLLGSGPATAVLVAQGKPIDPISVPNGMGQRVLDLRWPPPTKKGNTPDSRPILLTRFGFLISDNDAGYVTLNDDGDPASLQIQSQYPRPQKVMFRHDVGGDIWAFARGKTGFEFATVLSSWLLTRKNEAPTQMTRLWNDCSPCTNARILAIAPNRDGVANVEVVCGGSGATPNLNLVRVVGAASADPGDPCVTEPVTPGFDLTHATFIVEPVDETLPDGGPVPDAGITGRLAFDEAIGGGVVMGGKNGEVWHGTSFSQALPVFMDRVPLAVGTVATPLGSIPLAVTDQYLAAPIPNPFDPTGFPTGYKAFDLRKISDFVLAENERVRALINGAGGWAVLSSGDLIHLEGRAQTPDGGFNGGTFFSLDFGPRLLTARGEQTRAPFSGEAVTHLDGGIVSMVITGDDSVYLVPAPDESPARNGLPSVFPQLTPEPGSPIRSFALERTPIGTNGTDRVRGYAVTSRNLYLVSLSGSPARWNASPLLLGGGEPLEVWMDNPRGGLARVGYRDGTVYSLPGGFLLARPGSSGEPNQVLDYENLGGWPVAYATSGLWTAYYDTLPNGKLDNKLADGRPGKPMEWRKVTLPDGTEPWMVSTDGGSTARPGIVHVIVDQVGGAGDGGYQQVFRLSLYVDNAVYEIGTMTRTNVTPPKQ